MREKIILILIILYLSIQVYSQTGDYAKYEITNYTSFDYSWEEQNFAITNDNRGVMYFGNNKGILEYDGKNWKKILTTNNIYIRVLAKNDKGIVYVGTKNEFGFLTVDSKGELIYTILQKNLNDEIIKIYCLDNKIYFCSKLKIYIYQNNKSIKTINLLANNDFTFVVDNKIITCNTDSGLYVLENNELTKYLSHENLKGKTYKGIFKFSSDELLLVTRRNFFIYNTKTKTLLKDFFNPATIEFVKSGIYCALKINDYKYAIGTEKKGIIIIDNNGNIINQINKTNSNKINDDQITNLFLDNSLNLWATTFNGISKIEINTGIEKFGKENNLNGIVTEIKMFNNNLFLTTTYSTYNYVFAKDSFKVCFNKFDELENGNWDLDNNNNYIYISNDYGIYSIDKNNYINHILSKKSIRQICFFSNNKILILDDLYKLYISKIQNGMIENLQLINLENNIVSLNEYKPNNFIFTDSNSKIYKLTINENDTIVKEITKNEEQLKKSKYRVCSFLFENNVLIVSDKGIYEYNALTENLNTFLGFTERYSKLNINNIYNYKNEYYINYSDEKGAWIDKVTILDNNKIEIDSVTFKRITNKQIYVVFPDSNYVWIGVNNAVYKYNKNYKRDYDLQFNTLINKITIGKDSVIFNGIFLKKNKRDDSIFYSLDTVQNLEQILKIKFKLNSLVFEYSSAFYENEINTLFSYKLEGFNEEWSQWTNNSKAVFTNLNEGEYTFKVKAKNIYGYQSTIAEYKFEILPPWYRTYAAYFLYIVLLALFVWLLVYLNTRRLREQKKYLEQVVKERTLEIVLQKDAIELKNTELESQKKVIEHKNKEITDSIHYAQRIQNAVLPRRNILDELFPQNFILFKPRDIVSGDFYWFEKLGDYFIIAAADCTGHGVPGAFMSMVGMSFLNEIVRKKEVDSSAKILDELREKIKQTLHQNAEGDIQKDGMDISLYVINLQTMQLQYSGAHNPLYIIRNKELIEFKADRQPIGIHVKESNFKFEEIQLQKDDVVYNFSDGYVDQISGETKKKYLSKNLKILLTSIADKPMPEQYEIVASIIHNFQGTEEQVDDILMLGIKI